jgi:tripartite-type tricarboxylate transporter receptor subunit TctC
MLESGYPDFVMTFWTGVVAPAGTPSPIIDKLNAVINDALGSTEMKASFAKFRVEPDIGPPGHFAAFIAAEAKKWSKVITEAGINLN